MHSSWSHPPPPVIDSEQVKPRANSGLSFSGAHLLESQHLATSRSRSVPLLSVPSYHPDLDSSLWQPPRPSDVDSRSVTVDSTSTAQHDASPRSYEQRPSPVPQQHFGQDNWLSYPNGGLATVSEEPLETNVGEKQVSAQLEPPVSIPSDISDSETQPNMSVLSYPFPTALEPFDRTGHYETTNGSLASNPSLSAYDLPPSMEQGHEHSLSPLDPAAPPYSLSHDFPASQVISALATGASGNASSISPMSSREQDLARQRRRNHDIRRQSKTKMRRARSSTDPSYLPRSVNQDYGLGIQYSSSSAPTMAAAISTQPVANPTYLEHYDDTMAPAAGQTVYGGEYYGHTNAEFGMDSYQIQYGLHATSESPQPLYTPYTVPPLPAITVSTAHPMDAMYQQVNGRGISRSPGADEHVRVITARPKPQCWDHGCNGRQFSTFSNLLRHQREKSGTATKSYCPKCGAEFTRTTARNGHMQHEKCKSRTDA